MKHLTKDQLRCLEVIRFFREHPDSWCRGAFATDVYGYPCHTDAKVAARFCFMGAWIKLFTRGTDMGTLRKLGGTDMGTLRKLGVPVINDAAKTVDEMIEGVSKVFRV